MNADFYSSLGLKYERAFSHDPGLIAFLSSILKQLPPGAHILDAGCGTGKPVASTLAAAGHGVTGFDVSDTMVELSRRAVPSGSFQVADMRGYEPPDGAQFDAVLNILSLFRLDRESIEALAAAWGKWLKPGGLLCICTIAAEDMNPEGRGARYDADGRCARDIGMRFMGNTVQTTLFTRRGWESLLGERGFVISETTTVSHVPPPEADSEAEEHFYIVAKKPKSLIERRAGII